MGRPSSSNSTSVSLKEEVESVRVRDSPVDHHSSWHIARSIDIPVVAKEPGIVAFRAYADKDPGAIFGVQTSTGFENLLVLIVETSSVLAFRDTVPEDEDPFRQVAVVLSCKDLEMSLYHATKFLDDLLATLLKANLGAVCVTVGSVSGDRASYGRCIRIGGLDGWLH